MESTFPSGKVKGRKEVLRQVRNKLPRVSYQQCCGEYLGEAGRRSLYIRRRHATDPSAHDFADTRQFLSSQHDEVDHLA